jgi:hypothetical protein
MAANKRSARGARGTDTFRSAMASFLADLGDLGSELGVPAGEARGSAGAEPSSAAPTDTTLSAIAPPDTPVEEGDGLLEDLESLPSFNPGYLPPLPDPGDDPGPAGMGSSLTAAAEPDASVPPAVRRSAPLDWPEADPGGPTDAGTEAAPIDDPTPEMAPAEMGDPAPGSRETPSDPAPDWRETPSVPAPTEETDVLGWQPAALHDPPRRWGPPPDDGLPVAPSAASIAWPEDEPAELPPPADAAAEIDTAIEPAWPAAAGTPDLPAPSALAAPPPATEEPVSGSPAPPTSPAAEAGRPALPLLPGGAPAPSSRRPWTLAAAMEPVESAAPATVRPAAGTVPAIEEAPVAGQPSSRWAWLAQGSPGIRDLLLPAGVVLVLVLLVVLVILTVINRP